MNKSSPASTNEKDDLRGWVTPLLEQFFQNIPLIHDCVRKQTMSKKIDYEQKLSLMAERTDTYVVCWVIFDLLLYSLAVLNTGPLWIRIIVTFFATIRIVEIIIVMFKITLWNRRLPRGTQYFSFDRSIIMGIINYTELIVCFGAIYASWPQGLSAGTGVPMDWFDPAYFSCITIATVGFGDIKPSGVFRFVACIEVITGILLLVFILGRFVALVGPSDISLSDKKREKTKDTETV